MSLQPVHHVTAIRPSHRSHPGRINIFQGCQFIGNLHYILEYFSAPVTGNGTCESLTISRRAMRVRISHHITGSRINLPVATERIHPLHLWSAMHIDDKRIFLAGIKVVWLHDKYLYLVTTSTLYPDALRWTDIHLILQLLVKEGNLLLLAAGYRSSIPLLHLLAIESRWLACRAIGIIYHTLIVEIKLRDGLARQYRRDSLFGNVKLVERLCALHLTQEENTLAASGKRYTCH